MEDIIFVTLSTFAEYNHSPIEMLENSGHSFRIHRTGKRITSSEIIEFGSDAAVIIAGVEPYDFSTLSQLPMLRCISRCGVGVDAIDLADARQRGIVVSNTPMIPIQAVAEHALAMFLALSRNLCVQANLMRAQKWERKTGHLLEGRTVGLIGLGRIGRRVAQLCLAFKAKVIACDPFIERSVALDLGVDLVKMDQVLRESDILSLHSSKRLEEPVLIGAKELEKMKNGAVLINLARGGMVDEDALAAALKAGKLAGAGLDVYSIEPYQGSLCEFEQVILTPHSATLTVETRTAMEIQCVENALDFLSNRLVNERRVV